jgi:POT family proton-dependent oligopeptide transporter
MASSLGNLIAGIVGGHVDPNKLNEMPELFQRTALSLFIAAAVCAALIIPVRRLLGASDGSEGKLA